MTVTMEIKLLRVYCQFTNFILFSYKNVNKSSGKKIVFINSICPPHSCFSFIGRSLDTSHPSFFKIFPLSASQTNPLIISNQAKLQMITKYKGSLLYSKKVELTPALRKLLGAFQLSKVSRIRFSKLSFTYGVQFIYLEKRYMFPYTQELRLKNLKKSSIMNGNQMFK